jgi:hypothetical protein
MKRHEAIETLTPFDGSVTVLAEYLQRRTMPPSPALMQRHARLLAVLGLPAPDLSDIDRIHCVIRTDQLAEIFIRLADGRR